MPITTLTGLPGSGKSEQLIITVNTALEQERVALTFCCSDSPILKARRGIAEHRQLGSRSGLTTPLNYFVSAESAIRIVREAPSGALLAFEEAQHFGDGIVEPWCEASEQGVEIFITSPSPSQAKMLHRRDHEITRLTLTCQNCEGREASTFLCYLDEDRTESVCEVCHKKLQSEAEAEIVDHLRAQEPHPGEEKIYQPIELHECSNWDVIRQDSDQRFRVIEKACADENLPTAHSNYLDIGCNTGFFCYQMTKAGFRATGVDVVGNDISIARKLGTFFRRDYTTYVVSDAHEYLQSTQDQTFDVTSAFSVFQWVMIQNTPKHGLDCMRWLFGKTRRICILEMGESTEAHYAERIGMKYDRDWIYDFMQEFGGFDRIDIVDLADHNLKRDLFIGYK